MLWVVQHERPSGAWFCCNTCHHWSTLVVHHCNGSGHFFLHSSTKGCLWLWWPIMVSSLYHSFVSSRMSSLNFSMLGMLMTLQLLGLGHTSPIIFTVSNSWAQPMAIFLKLLTVFWWFLPPISWLLRHSSHLLEFTFVLVTAILGFIGEPPNMTLGSSLKLTTGVGYSPACTSC